MIRIKRGWLNTQRLFDSDENKIILPSQNDIGWVYYQTNSWIGCGSRLNCNKIWIICPSLSSKYMKNYYYNLILEKSVLTVLINIPYMDKKCAAARIHLLFIKYPTHSRKLSVPTPYSTTT